MATWAIEARRVRYSTLVTHPQTREGGGAARRDKWQVFTLPDKYHGGDNIVYKWVIKRVLMATKITLVVIPLVQKPGKLSSSAYFNLNGEHVGVSTAVVAFISSEGLWPSSMLSGM